MLVGNCLKQESKMDFQRLRKQVAFGRLLARLFAQSDSPFFLKGGYAMELRLSRARTTRDIDVTLLRMRPLDMPRAAQALQRVFRIRDTYALPELLMEPPGERVGPFAVLAAECGLSPAIRVAFVKPATLYSGLRANLSPSPTESVPDLLASVAFLEDSEIRDLYRRHARTVPRNTELDEPWG